MLLLLQVSEGLTAGTEALKVANESRDIVLVVAVVVIAFVLLFYSRRTESKADADTSKNMGDLIKYLGKLSELTDYIKETKDDDAELKKGLTSALVDLKDGLAGFQKNVVDHQKLIDGSMALLRTSIDQLIAQNSKRYDDLEKNINEVLQYVQGQPGKHKEVTDLLENILKVVQQAQEARKTAEVTKVDQT